MSQYTGLLFSADEYWPIGPFRFPIYKDLVPGEAKGIEALAREQSKGTYASLKLAQRIAQDKKIPVKEAVELMSNANEQDNQELLFAYAEELEALGIPVRAGTAALRRSRSLLSASRYNGRRFFRLAVRRL